MQPRKTVAYLLKVSPEEPVHIQAYSSRKTNTRLKAGDHPGRNASECEVGQQGHRRGGADVA